VVLSPSAAYVVDIMHARSAESMAANRSVASRSDFEWVTELINKSVQRVSVFPYLSCRCWHSPLDKPDWRCCNQCIVCISGVAWVRVRVPFNVSSDSSDMSLHFPRLLWCTIRYGDQMRGWVDVGYSTAENN
jgi:hypothetical protein